MTQPRTSRRIAIVVSSLTGGGAEAVAFRWAEELVRRGHSVRVLVTQESASKHRGGHDAFEVVFVGSQKLGHLGVIAAITRQLKVFRPAAVVGLMPYWNLLSLIASALSGKNRPDRCVVSEHSIHGINPRAKTKAFRAQVYLAKLLYRYADGVIAVSHPVAADVITRFSLDKSKVWVVPNPVLQGRDTRVAGIPEPNERDGGITIAFAGRVDSVKRPLLLIDVACRVRELLRVPVCVDIFGTGRDSEELSRYAKRHDVECRMHGWVSDWTGSAREGSVVLLPSVIEGFGNVLVEAANAGFVSVASSTALGVADACIPEVTAVLAADDSVGALAEAIIRARRIETIDRTAIANWLARFSSSSSCDVLEHALFSGAVAEDVALANSDLGTHADPSGAQFVTAEESKKI